MTTIDPTAPALLAPKRRQLIMCLAAAALPFKTLAQSNVTRLVVPYTPGASNDVIARLVAEAVSKKTGRSWIVENKPGAGSMLGADFVARSQPDGRTLLLAASANMGILPAIQKNMRYAVERDFTFLARIASGPFGLVINSQLPVTDLAGFVRLAKSKPDGIRIGTAGIGALDYMGIALMQSTFGVDFNVIPFKGMSPVINDLRAGHIDACVVSPPTIQPMVQEGKVKMLALFDTRRSDVLPNVPTAAELGYPQLKLVNWWGIAGPAKLPAAVVTSLRQDLMKVLGDPEFLASLREKGFDPAVLTGDELNDFVLSELKGWKALATKANITME